MEDKAIEISTNLTAEDFKRIGFKQIRAKLIVIGSVVVVFVILMLMGVITSSLSKKNSSLAVFLPLLIPVGIFSFILLSFVWTINKQAKQLGDKFEPTDYIFDEQGMKAENASTSVKTLWSSFLKVEETNTDFLLFTQKSIAVPIPKRFFVNDVQLTGFKQLLMEKLGKQAKLKN